MVGLAGKVRNSVDAGPESAYLKACGPSRASLARLAAWQPRRTGAAGGGGGLRRAVPVSGDAATETNVRRVS